MNTNFIKKTLVLCISSFAILANNSTVNYAQNNCTDAIVIPGIPYSSGVLTTCGTGDDYPAGSYGRSASYGDGDDYVFQLDITTAPVSLSFTLGGSANWKILDINSTCDPLAANSLGGCITNGITTMNVANVTFPINGTYFIFVDTWTAADCGEFTLDINPTVPSPPNDVCTGAIDLGTGTALISETTVGGNEEANAETCSGLLSDYAHDNWYYILADDDADITVSVSSSTEDMVIEVYSGACMVPTFEACANDVIGPGDEEIVFPASTGVTYFIRVYSYNDLDGATYDIVAIGSPLAIELSDISAMNKGNTNLLKWSSTKETIGDAYVIERSKDGKDFEAMESMQAKGEASDYQYVDNSPFFGTNYYRVKLLHDNGKISYSKIVSAIVQESNESIKLFPNPSTGIITIQLANVPSKDANITITNLIGREVKVVENFQTTNVGIDISDLPSGIYFVKYFSKDEITTIKLIKE